MRCSHGSPSVEGGVIRFQPWLTLEAADWAGDEPEVIQPASQWLAGADMGTLRVWVQVSYISGCTLYLESSITPEGPWSTLEDYTLATDSKVTITSDGYADAFSGYVRWRVAGTSPWVVCFQLKVTPGERVVEATGMPIRV